MKRYSLKIFNDTLVTHVTQWVTVAQTWQPRIAGYHNRLSGSEDRITTRDDKR